MYPGTYATTKADQPCFIMATSGEVVTYGEFESRTNRLAHLLRDQGLAGSNYETYGEYEARTNRLAHLLRDQGLQRLDHYSIFMENNPRYLEMCGAGERAGLYYTAINSHLTADELAYIVNNSESRVFITSREARRGPRGRADVPGRRALAGGRRRPRRGPVRGLPDGRVRLPRHADRRRAPGRVDAVLVGHDRAAEGDPPPARRRRRPTRRWR